MNGKSIVIKKLEEETLSKVSGGGEKFEAFNQAMSVAGLSAVVAGGLSSKTFVNSKIGYFVRSDCRVGSGDQCNCRAGNIRSKSR